MSAAKDKFYELLVPKIVILGFQYKSSKSIFVKIENGLEYKISFRWDGRGGVTILDSVEVFISDIEIQKGLKKRTGYTAAPPIYMGWGHCSNNVSIPVMYSKKTLDLANNMNFKDLSQLNQEEKYPPERILNSANFVEQLILNNAIPFIEKFKNSSDIYNFLVEKIKNITNIDNFLDNQPDFFQQYNEQLGLPMPKILNKISNFDTKNNS